ncbi:Zn-dependent exopeptidase [Metschnikowia bicuspidata var. bicuspidata NRRL YB-4993]|uniref:Peptide hydrolase n=1 Tax=Metschnikowia bicuspidata var. bicuspidata NRRL YB-4993 TaxID=869754 RepID=A0A1A0HKH1_9ASCO|nr:Zn-dependent exopeptidase [Metschnikowia bicuspidata var. bicuspidata NRRL YB-4993]OBA24392.1 Zn-dependent exopeptidase [Metschnikowia bicuspidata var. bicuspidata NRRL YB-4993]
MALEISPLLAPQLADEQTSFDDTRSKFTLELRNIKHFLHKRFWWLCALGVAAIITLQLSFLPRTSPSRDFRRWHGLHFTRSDVKRIFLVQLDIGVPDADGRTVEQNLLVWLKQLSAINSRNPPVAREPGLPAAAKMTAFVESAMRSMHFLTTTHTFAVLDRRHLPVSLLLCLVDGTSSRVLYTAMLHEPGSEMPAYYLFGKNGTVQANYVFCNAGTPEDFRLLEEQAVLLKNKIAVFSHSLLSEYALEDKVELAESAGCVGTVVFGDKELGEAISRNFKPALVPEPKLRLPMSFKAAGPILLTLAPPSAEFANWNFGPTTLDETLELVLTSEFSGSRTNATNVVGAIEGVLNDSEIIIGASRDVLTSSNPSSGHAIMLETMRKLSHLQTMGWKPLRTIRFISWDASRNSAMGSLENVKDDAVFPRNLPILAYINLDGDVVTGSHFAVDSSPLFNHILRTTADLIPFPRNSPYYRRLIKDAGATAGTEKHHAADDAEKHDNDDSEVSFLRYWGKQDHSSINNKLGYVFAGKDSGTFQLRVDTPVVSLKFEPSPKFNDTTYVPESESYSMKWVTEELDPNLDLHALMVRFLGLFVLSLSEHEVVDSRVRQYFLKVQEFFQEMKTTNKHMVDTWSNETVSSESLKKSSIYYDAQEAKNDWDGPVTFKEILSQLEELIKLAVDQGRVFDKYNQGVEDLWTTDYPWYKMIRKLHVYAKFKVTNYKLLRLEKELGQMVIGLDAKDGDVDGDMAVHHFMYDIPQGTQSIAIKKKRGAFAVFYEAFDAESKEQVVNVAAAKYERLKAVYKKIT